MKYQEQKMIQEAGTPALLCFKPEELPTDCRITSLINMIIYSRYNHYINLSHNFVDFAELFPTEDGLNAGDVVCLKDYIREKELITVCCEYQGKENLIKSFLLEYLRKDYPTVDTKIIRFGKIGKSSNAHAVAIDVFRGNRRPNRILSLNEVEKCLKKI